MNDSLADMGFHRVGVFTRRKLDLEALIEALMREGFDDSLGFVPPTIDDEHLLVGADRLDRPPPAGVDQVGLAIVDKYWFMQFRRWRTTEAAERCYLILDEGDTAKHSPNWLPHRRFLLLEENSDEHSIAAAAADLQERQRVAAGGFILWMIDDEIHRFGSEGAWGQVAALGTEFGACVVRSAFTPDRLRELGDGLLESWSRRLIEPATRQRTPLVVLADNQLVDGGEPVGLVILNAVIAKSPEADCYLASGRDKIIGGTEAIKPIVLTSRGSLVPGEERKIRTALKQAREKIPQAAHDMSPPPSGYFGVATELPPSVAGFDDNLHPDYLNNPFRFVPLLDFYSKPPGGAKPFGGKDIIFVLHFLRDLVPFVIAAERLGLEPPHGIFLYKRYPYPQRAAIGHWLHERGYTVLPVERHGEVLERFSPCAERKILVVEDGGYFAPALHRSSADLLQQTVGVVEQTTRGILAIEDWKGESSDNQVKIPILSVAGSNLKSAAEPRHVATAVVRNLTDLLEIPVVGRKAAVIGCGTIGISLIERLLAERAATVYAFDRYDANKLVAAQESGAAAQFQLSDAVRDADFCFGCSGRTSLNKEAFRYLKSGAHLVSASSEQYEIDIDELSRQSSEQAEFQTVAGKLAGTKFRLSGPREIYLVTNGYPINFWGMNSLPDQVSGLIMTLILLSAAELVERDFPAGVDEKAVNELAKRHQLAERYLEQRGPR